MRASNIRIGRASAVALYVGLTVSATGATQRGEVTTATLSAVSSPVGSPVTVAVTGRNPCGAVHIDWGDGTAITYPIVELTTTQKHVYERSGTFTIVARGMGNCDGGTSLKVRIDPAPAAPSMPERPHLSSFTVSIPAPVGSPVGVTAHGKGQCRLTVDFGDGKSQKLTVPLPHTVRHVYDSPGSYVVVAQAIAPCEGRHSVKLEVANAEPTARLLGLKIAPNPAVTRSPVSITVDGRGRCQVTVDFGDGADQRIEASLPARISHSYARSGVFEVFAWADAPCGGEATGSLRVTRR